MFFTSIFLLFISIILNLYILAKQRKKIYSLGNQFDGLQLQINNLKVESSFQSTTIKNLSESLAYTHNSMIDFVRTRR